MMICYILYIYLFMTEYFNDPTNPVQDELQITLIELQQDSDRDVRYSAHLQEDDDEFEFTTTD